MEMRSKYKDAFQKKYNLKLGFMSAFVKATAFALQDQPVVNAVIDELEIVYRDYIDISVAVSTPKVEYSSLSVPSGLRLFKFKALDFLLLFFLCVCVCAFFLKTWSKGDLDLLLYTRRGLEYQYLK